MGLASRGLPSTHPLEKPFRRSSRCPIRGVTPARCPISFAPHFPSGAKDSSAPGNCSAPTPALTSCSSLGSGNAAGLAASAPPAGDTVLQGTPLRQPTHASRRSEFHLCRVTPWFGSPPWEG
uniref:Uncharacterized protein n=1 Tax=Mus musculus TaxID=10090 RepID=Q9D5C3_MOUSE|nr:unnamed protein product [Mus musculus]